jgi:hypothetical protein
MLPALRDPWQHRQRRMKVLERLDAGFLVGRNHVHPFFV